MDWNIDWNGGMDYWMELFCVYSRRHHFQCILAIASFIPFHSVRLQGGGMDASQHKAELTIGRLVSKQPLSRVWHCSETMFLNDSIAHCVVHSTVPAVSCSVIRHPLFQCLSIS